MAEAVERSEAVGDPPEPASIPELVPASDRIPGWGLQADTLIEQNPESEIAESGFKSRDAEGNAAAPPPMITGYNEFSLPGNVSWGVLSWDYDQESYPHEGFLFELYRASDGESVFTTNMDYTQSSIGLGFALEDAESPILPGVAYYATIRAITSPELSEPAVSDEFYAIGLPGLTDEAARGDCVCETSTGRLFPLNVLRGDPVNTATGVLTESVTDATLPGVGPALSVTRTYNSDDESSGPLGRGWSFPYFASLAADASAATYTAEDGQQVVFNTTESGFETPPGLSSRLSSTSNGEFELETKDHQVVEFDKEGRLTGAKDASGEGVSLSYASGGAVERVSSTTGREFDIEMNQAGLLTSISLPDGRSVEYGYTKWLVDVGDGLAWRGHRVCV